MIMLDVFDRANYGPWNTSRLDVQWRIEKYGPLDRERHCFVQCSQSCLDWLINFIFLPVAFKNMEEPFHFALGYKLAFRSIFNDVMRDLEGAEKIMIGGYSYGGPLAEAIHEAVWFNLGFQPDTFSFGGSGSWKGISDNVMMERFSKVTSISVRGDLVFNATSILGHQHVGQVIELGPSSNRLHWKHHRQEEYQQYLKNLTLSEVENLL